MIQGVVGMHEEGDHAILCERQSQGCDCTGTRCIGRSLTWTDTSCLLNSFNCSGYFRTYHASDTVFMNMKDSNRQL